MSSSVFVRDAEGTPLMPTSAAYARRLLQRGKARWVPHHAFPIIQLSQVVTLPVLRPVVVAIHIHLQTAELIVLAYGDIKAFLLLHLVVDLRTDLPIRIRRRAGHRRRRRARGRYRPMRQYSQPFKRRRPSMARSAWGRVVRPRLRRMSGSRPWSVSPTLRWRAQAIVRIIAALQAFLPVSDIVILSPRQIPRPVDAIPAASLRERLINAYGQVTADGTRVAMCAYCGTTVGRIEVDHVLPQSRGGTDAWSNRVLACAVCNAQKGDRTPEEAGMPLRIPMPEVSTRPNRAGVYPQQTARLLVHDLRRRGISVSWSADGDGAREDVSTSFASIAAALNSWPTSTQLMVVRPIARPVKQIYSAHNYPLSTPQRAGYVRIGTTIKRRIQVNQALVITEHPERCIEVVPVNTAVPNDGRQIVRLGMLCEGIRNEQHVTGVVAAIHSSGRLTLLTPEAVRDHTVVWHRIVVSPRKHLRILSTERVLFMKPIDSQASGAVAIP